MIHFTFFTNILSLCTASVALTLSFLFYKQYQKKVILSFAGMLFMVMLLVINRTIELYGTLIAINHSTGLTFIVNTIEKSAFLLGLIAGPLFCFQLIGMHIDKRINLLFKAGALIYAISAIIEIALHTSPSAAMVRKALGLPILFGAYCTLCIIAALKLETLGNHFLNRSLKLFFSVSVLILPAALIKYIRGVPYLPFHLENSLSLLLVTVGSLFFAYRYFNQPLYYQKGKLSDYFRSRYGTTTREEDIILHTLNGKSNNDIADTLCISVRTVESHLYNIFQKTGVKNRTQLHNLIRTNSTE